MADNTDLQKQCEELASLPAGYASQSVDTRVPHAIGVLGLSVLKLDSDVEKLDRTSTFLALVNIGVGVIVVFIGILQVCLMLRGH
jgi:hypothetical protein